MTCIIKLSAWVTLFKTFYLRNMQPNLYIRPENWSCNVLRLQLVQQVTSLCNFLLVQWNFPDSHCNSEILF